MIWYPAPKGSLSGFKKVKILDFWYGFKKEIAIGNNAKNARPEIAKNFTLTPASHATVRPPAAISNAVPKSGWVATNIIGAIKTTTGKNKYLTRFKFSIEVRC